MDQERLVAAQRRRLAAEAEIRALRSSLLRSQAACIDLEGQAMQARLQVQKVLDSLDKNQESQKKTQRRLTEAEARLKALDKEEPA